MSTGEIDQVSQFVSDNLTKKMYLNNRRYWNENGQFLHGYHHEDVVALVKRALNTKELVSSPNRASTQLKIGKLRIAQSRVAPDHVYIGEAEGGEGGDFHKSDLAPVLEKFYSDNF